jgi:LytS/YehU family sensor histidine kinase
LQSKINEQVLQKEKAIAELKFLKAQISPHFLFNTLNNIYSLARKESKLTPEVILKLSKLMRFMLYDASSPTILLIDELKLIEDYIALEKLRYSDRLRVEFKSDLDFPSQRMAPLLLIHFVENAFKHGASESRFDSFISIHVELKKGMLLAKITNTTEEHQQLKEDNAIGLNNMKRQLELLYPKHTLTITKEIRKFSIELIIPLS